MPTVTRMPRMHPFPPITPASWVMRSSCIMLFSSQAPNGSNNSAGQLNLHTPPPAGASLSTFVGRFMLQANACRRPEHGTTCVRFGGNSPRCVRGFLRFALRHIDSQENCYDLIVGTGV